MTNLPKELEEIRDDFLDDYWSFEEELSFKKGFHHCYEAMLKTHVPREKVEKLVEVYSDVIGHTIAALEFPHKDNNELDIATNNLNSLLREFMGER